MEHITNRSETTVDDNNIQVKAKNFSLPTQLWTEQCQVNYVICRWHIRNPHGS